MALSLQDVNEHSADSVVDRLEGIYASSPWVVQRALASRPFATLTAFTQAMVQAVNQATRQEQLDLIQAQLDIVSVCEQRFGAQRSDNTHDTHDTHNTHHSIVTLAADYEARFGFQFVLDSDGPRGAGLAQDEVLATLERRLRHPVDFEIKEALRHIHRMAQHRVKDLFDAPAVLGNQLWDWCEQLAVHSESPYAERGELTVTYLTEEHQACAAQIAHLMRDECGFDEVQIDAVGNVIGVYHGQDEGAKRLLTGSHYDTVRNGGKYDGRLGIFAPMLCVQQLVKQARRLPFGIEVIAFAEEEGQRYKAVFLGSGALTGEFDMTWLDQADADGVTMRQAMQIAGLEIDDIDKLKRDPTQYLGFVEVHIEQGPVLTEHDLPLGVVTSINGSVRFMGEIVGMASHAGTTPMDMRHDAAVAAAELALYVERRASASTDLVATMGMLDVPNGSVNVVPGRCRFSLDVRATTDGVRDACVADIKAELQQICQRRTVQFELEEFMRASAAPSAPAWQARWAQAVQSLGLPVFHMPSGAGHDAMKLHKILPQAMLFVRGLNSGISHNPLEMTSSDDAQLCVEAFAQLIEQLAQEQAQK